MYVLDFAAKLLGGPPCYPIGSLFELLIPIGPLFQFSNYVKAYSRTPKKHKHFCASLEYVLPVHRYLLEYGRGHSGTLLESIIRTLVYH